MFIRALCIATFLFFSSSAWSEEKYDVYMVEIAAFSCPHCNELNGHVALIERALGDKFIFAPIPTSRNNTLMERLWYGIRDMKNALLARESLFGMLHKMRMLSYNETDLVEWVRIQGFDEDPEDLIKKMNEPASQAAMERAIRLAIRAEISHVPAFVILSGTNILEVIQRDTESSAEFVRLGLDRYRHFAGGRK